MNLPDLHNACMYIFAHWRVIAGYAVSGLGISIALQTLKRHFQLDKRTVKIVKLIRLDGPRIVVVMLTVLTAISTAVTYLLDPVNVQYIPKDFSFLLTAAFFVHRFAVSPIGTRIEKALKPYWQALEQLKESEQKTIAPATVITPNPEVVPFTLPQQGK